jgi:hypothetical protein
MGQLCNPEKPPGALATTVYCAPHLTTALSPTRSYVCVHVTDRVVAEQREGGYVDSIHAMAGRDVRQWFVHHRRIYRPNTTHTATVSDWAEAETEAEAGAPLHDSNETTWSFSTNMGS